MNIDLKECSLNITYALRDVQLTRLYLVQLKKIVN